MIVVKALVAWLAVTVVVFAAMTVGAIALVWAVTHREERRLDRPDPDQEFQSNIAFQALIGQEALRVERRAKRTQ